ncbi:hypothetical protein AKJ37_04720 [candidate division MSBL1 archaeon SCGC-AAA259I09]|uniref:Cell division protein FtsZ n=2 Tax=candidate division MSBL1 TaxID=215777 RepID=A0A133UT99_9EURY|nr:hypothetical protein AKJ37_04720 [candidate division MSBL1 archaeon SCGC-AAA259I09]KXA97461.1 hypothetical protein AKJ38_01185 [candidate division MSBL1 archaeon SCGC-AAA259I14]
MIGGRVTARDPSSDEFEQVVSEAGLQLLAVGCGGAGCNTISRLMEMGVQNVRTVAFDTDPQDLLYTRAGEKVLIGREVTGGRGAGNILEKGKEAAEADRDLIKDSLSEADMMLVTCGLGGGTGTGAGPVVAEIAERLGCLTVGVLTLPFESEGKKRERNASVGLEKFRNVLDSLVIIPDDKLLEIAPDLSLAEAFRFADKLLADSIKGITGLVANPGLINLDFADIETVLDDGGVTMVGFGRSDSENRAVEAAEGALKNPLLDVDTSEVDRALVNIVGSPDMALGEAETATRKISKALTSGAQVTWGAQIKEKLEKKMKVMVLAPGVESPWGEGVENKRKRDRAEEALKDLKSLS